MCIRDSNNSNADDSPKEEESQQDDDDNFWDNPIHNSYLDEVNLRREQLKKERSK